MRNRPLRSGPALIAYSTVLRVRGAARKFGVRNAAAA